MRKSLFVRSTVVAVVCLICVLFVCRFFSNNSEASASQSSQAAVVHQLDTSGADAHLEWAVIAVLLSGIAVFVFWPRRNTFYAATPHNR